MGVADGRVVVVGAGGAGLTCTTALLRGGYRQVCLVDGAPFAGGRARSFFWRKAGMELDISPHMVMGCYRDFGWLLSAIGSRLPIQEKLRVEMRGPGSAAVVFAENALGRFGAIASASGIPLRDRLSIMRALSQSSQLRRVNDVEEWLQATRQTAVARRCFWDPFVKAVLNQGAAGGDPHQLDRVLRRAFLDSDADPRLGHAASGLNELYVRPAVDAIRNLDGEVILRDAVMSVERAGERLDAVRLRSGRRIEGRHFIFAVPPGNLQGLLPEVRVSDHECHPIVALHLLLTSPLPLPQDSFVGLLDGAFHWLFVRPAGRGRWVASLVASDARELVRGEPGRIEEIGRRALYDCFPGLPTDAVLATVAVKERMATYSWKSRGQPRCCGRLPPNVAVAGDWTDTDYPCTIEAAARSGRQAAEKVLSGSLG